MPRPLAAPFLLPERGEQARTKKAPDPEFRAGAISRPGAVFPPRGRELETGSRFSRSLAQPTRKLAVCTEAPLRKISTW